MNKKHYNNVIDWTLKHDKAAQTEDSLATARAVFKNMGVALPNGSMQDVYDTIKTNKYMGWRACTMQEAQEAANKGTAAIGISKDRVVILSAADEEEPVAETASVMTLSEKTSAFAVTNLEYYTYSCSTTHQNGCGDVEINTILANGTYYLNNKHCGKYLRYESTHSVFGRSGLLNDLGTSIQWEIQNYNNAYIIHAKNDSKKYLGVPASTSSDIVELVSVDDGSIPQRCIWSISRANGGSCLIKNVYNSKYLYTYGTILYTDSITGIVDTEEYNTRVWRIASTSLYGNTNSYKYRELPSNCDFSDMRIDIGQTLMPSLNTSSSNILWAKPSDFEYLFNSTTYFTLSGANQFTGLNRGPAVTVTAIHKVTGYQKTFKVTVNSNMDTFLNNLSELYNVAYIYNFQNQSKALETTFKYIRTKKYNDGWWPGVAGETDNTFNSYVEDYYPAINNYFSCDVDHLNETDYIITIPDTATNEKIDLLHMMATLNRLFYSGTTTYNGIPVDAVLGDAVDDLCGWAGDFQALIRDYFDAGNNHSTQSSVYGAFYPMIGSNDYFCAYSDIIADMDSCNLCSHLSNSVLATGEDLKKAFEDYYYGKSGNVATKRFTTWIGTMNENQLNNKISTYCNDHSTLIIKWPILKPYSIFDYQQNAFAEAFVDYLLTQKNLENLE